MSGWGRSARRLAGAVALALALTATAVLAGWGQPGAPVFALGDAPPPGDPAAQGRALARRPAEDLPPNGAARARRPAGWSPAALPRGEAAPGRVGPLLGVIGYKPAVVARLDPRTLRPLPGPRIRLRYGVSGYGWSPDRSLLVLGDVDDDVLHLVDPVRLRRLGTVRFGIVARAPRWLAWLGPRRLAVVAGDPGDGAHLLLVDPVARKVLSRRQLEPAGLSVVPAGDRLVLLQSPSDRLGPVRLLVVDARGRVRTAGLPGVTAGVQSPPNWDRPGAYAVSRDAALAVDFEGGRAFVAAAGATVAEVDLASLQVTYRHLRQPVSLLRRLARWLVPPAEAKLSAGTWRSACWLGDGSLAIMGTDTSVTGKVPAERRMVVRASGLKLLDTRSWTVRPLDPAATAARWEAGRLLAFGTVWDPGSERERGVGLTVYGPGDRRPRHLLGTQAVMDAHLDGDLVYASVDNGNEQWGRVVASLGSGRVLASSPAPLPFLLRRGLDRSC